MKVLIDTNILLDIILAREPFVKDSAEILRWSEQGKIEGFITTNSIVDTIYIIKKYINDKNLRENSVRTIVTILEIVSVNKKDLLKAFDMGFSDYEDALVAQCALKIKADYIITRDCNDFIKSPVKAVSPKDFFKI
jgi:predicted nucleic acid-binding protein